MTFKERIGIILEDSLKEAIKDGVFPNADFPPFRIEYPKEQKFGDYAVPFAIATAKILRCSPMETAEKLKPYIEKHSLVGRVEIAAPGYINIFAAFGELCSNLKHIISQDREYGRRKKDNPRRINIEFVSANPTGPLNIVSARAAALGDTIANLFEASGDKAEREFYVNDYGNQVYLLGRSVLARIRELQGTGTETDFPEDGYHGAYVKDIAAYIVQNFGKELGALNGEEELIAFCAVHAVERNVAGQQKDLSGFNVTFDRWFREKSLHEAGAVQNTFGL
ncbi:MAG: arginine--tRNA ligase, partial [Spirochaetia bacterium]|nr:arginine--tRNA ligase [Spirochaetia bacterium]